MDQDPGQDHASVRYIVDDVDAGDPALWVAEPA